MRLVSDIVDISSRALEKCCAEVEPHGSWEWLCVSQNGRRLNLSATLADGFLHIACLHPPVATDAAALQSALHQNRRLNGNAKLALDPVSGALKLRTEIAVVDEPQLLSRLRWALDGLHRGASFLKPQDPHHVYAGPQSGVIPAAPLEELLQGTAWQCTQRGPDEFSVELDAEGEPHASVRLGDGHIDSTVELARANSLSGASRRALAVFLLTASGSMRLVRAFTPNAEDEADAVFALQVSLPALPAAEEFHHALAALSVAHRVCAREAAVLLNEAAACQYLAARNMATHHQPQFNQEN